MAHYSLNEIEASARKAARGAGMTWGLAEEAGKATRWLAARGLPNVTTLLTLLKENDGKDYQSLCPQNMSNSWSASGGVLCPIIAGSTLNDLAHNIILGQEINLESVQCPALILPILGRASKALAQGFIVCWDDVVIKILPDMLYLEKGKVVDVGITFAAKVMVAGLLSDDINTKGQKIDRVVQGVPLGNQDWSDLQVLAARTYVPASEESRRLGAGAGLTDND
ncbi:DUF3726 domain-containing protein [Kiloniella sp.]|uniref:DUF3726 domain-containing protein n=1 Tax=Kiloniella sp. TaxID=1938587 RepID=UPI003B0173A8